MKKLLLVVVSLAILAIACTSALAFHEDSDRWSWRIIQSPINQECFQIAVFEVKTGGRMMGMVSIDCKYLD